MVLCAPSTDALGNYLLVADVGHLPVANARYAGLLVFQVDTKQLKQWDGTGWVIESEPAQTWTPSFASGVTPGNGVWSNSWFHRSDGIVDVAATFQLGTTSVITATSISGIVIVNLPVAAYAILVGDIAFEFVDTSAGVSYPGSNSLGSGTFVSPTTIQTSATYAFGVGVINTIPFTWASTDTIKLSGRYRMNTRYL